MKLIIIFCLNLFLITRAFAGGAFNYEIAAPDNGWSSAGRAANANDSSTIYGNPAGISNLEKVEVMIGIQPKYQNVTFNDGQSNPDLNVIIPDGSVFWATRINKDFHFGLGLLSFMGLDLDYGDDWAGNQYATQVSLTTIDLVPAFSYRAEKLWYIGIGLDLLWGKFKQNFMTSTPGPLPLGRKIELSDSNFKIGWNIGFLIFLTEGTRIGVKYRSQAKFKFEFEIEGIKPNLDMYVPQEAMISSYSELGKTWTLMVSAGWQNWSKFKNMAMGFGPLQDVITMDLKDTFHLSVGTTARLGESSKISLGLAYDTSAANDKNRTLIMPFDTQMRASLGYMLDVNKLSTLSFNLSWIGMGEAPINVNGPNRPNIVGNYDPNMLYSFGANYNWKW